MISFTVALLLLVVGYFVYGSFVERVFKPDANRRTPCYQMADGADFVPMPTWKVFTVQFLNIAGTGPIFGALMGILYGPAAFLWIVLGCILGGAVHDYMAGMISIRRGGASLTEIIGTELGQVCRTVMLVVTLVLMVCVGATFVMVPAGLMDQLTAQLVGQAGTHMVWVVLIFAFYLAVTVLSIDKIVGNVYPVFGFALLLMAVLVGVSIFTQPGSIPEVTEALADHYPTEGHTPLFPGMFVSIACGAVSGFHATQSPMMARCLKNEKYGLRCFYGAMVTEGVVTLIWAAAAIKFADAMDVPGDTPYAKLLCILTDGGRQNMNPGTLVNMMCSQWLGRAGLVLAILGIVAAPMSTGGTAFRCARLIIADFTRMGQAALWRRAALAAPLFAAAALMLAMKFDVLWRYVSWLNQVLATFTFFSISHWMLGRRAQGQAATWAWLMTFVPGVFMLAVSSSFIMVAPEGLGLPHAVGYPTAAVVTVVLTALFLRTKRRVLAPMAALLVMAALPVAANAQQVWPQPQQAEYGAAAFARGEAYQLVQGVAGDRRVRQWRKLIPERAEGYYLAVEPGRVVVAGRDSAGLFYGMQTLRQLLAMDSVPVCRITDWPSVECRGVIEGFYGNPWSHEDRLRQFDFYGQHKLNTYVYGPKDDPYHRQLWREPYPQDEAARLSELVSRAAQNHVQFVWALHPGGDIQWTLADSLAALRKLEAVYDMGVRTFAVFFDDISGPGAKAEKQAALLNYLTAELVDKRPDVRPLLICPTQYNRAWSSGDYLSTLGRQLHPSVRVMWTGNTVVDMIDRADMEWINAQLGRKAFIWLNYPVNDYCQSRLLMGRTYGNGLDIADMVSGFCSNPMEYAEASKVSLWSIADYTWNMAEYRPAPSWQAALRGLMPTASQAFAYFCTQCLDLGKTGHGLRREGESEGFAPSREWFANMQTMAAELLADSVNSPHMLAEIAPWARSMQLLGLRGSLVCQMAEDLDNADTVAFVGRYRAQRAADRQQKAIVSRDYPGSVVKARPVVSGDVVTPWVNATADSLVAIYRARHTYGADAFPVTEYKDGEYIIKIDGKYLTNSADNPAAPILVAERDMVNPQRQQWVIEQEPANGRYKVTNKQDGRYLTGRLAFPRSRQAYDPQQHTLSGKDLSEWDVKGLD